LIVEKLLTIAAGQKYLKRPSKIKDVQEETWNILSLYRSGALRNLIEVTQEYGTDLLAIKEVRCLEKSILEKENCTVYYSFHDKNNIVLEWISLSVNFYEQGLLISSLLI
jgi:hypothetical protein